MDPSDPSSSSSDLNVVPNGGNAALKCESCEIAVRDDIRSSNDNALTDEVLDEIWEAAIRMIHTSQHDNNSNLLDTVRDASGTMTCIG